MSKKLILVLLMATLLAGGAFAQFSMSAGLGGTFTADFVNYAWTKEAKEGVPKDMLNFNDTNVMGGGFFAYFDATYVMLSLGMGFHGLSPANKDQKKAMDDAKMKKSLTTFDIGLFLKYPIAMGKGSLFPILGGDFKIATAYTMSYNGVKASFTESVSEYYTTIWGKLGLGADIPLGSHLYLRPMFLYGVGTLYKEDKLSQDYYNSAKKTVTVLNHGLDVKLALGYKF